MKKKNLIVIIALFAIMAVPVLAANPLATLINTFGDKVVVSTGSSEAQSFFGQGYVLYGSQFAKPTCTCQEVGAAGPTFSSKVFLQDGVITGGKTLIATSTMNTAFTLTAAQVCNNRVIKVNTAATANFVAAASLDITMPATSTLFSECLRNDGDEVEFLFINASPTAASTTEFVAGTGCEGMISGDTGAADTIAGMGAAKITLKRIKDFWGVNGTADCIFNIEELVKD
jgi:hypothetical protein